MQLQLGSVRIDPLNAAGHSTQTNHVMKETNPVFNARLELQLPSPAAIKAAAAAAAATNGTGSLMSDAEVFRLKVEVWDWNKTKRRDVMGVLAFDIRQLFATTGWDSTVGPLAFPFKEPSESSGNPGGLKAAMKKQAAARQANGEPPCGSVELRFSFTPTPEAEARMSNTFYRFDADCNGVLDAAEALQLMQAAGMPAGDDFVTDLVETYGEDRGGVRAVSLLGFQKFWEQLRLSEVEFAPPQPEPEPEPEPEEIPAWVSELFNMADGNSDGVLDAAELSSLLEGFGMGTDAQRIAELLAVAGVDNSIPLSRFSKFLQLVGVYDGLAAVAVTPRAAPDEPAAAGAGGPHPLAGAFDLFDLDGDGMLSPEELLNMFVSLNYQVDGAYVQEALSMFGKQSPGFLTLPEFGLLAKEIQLEERLLALAPAPSPAAVAVTPPVRSPSPKPISAFDRFDLDGDGRLSEDEVMQMLTSLNYQVDGSYIQQVLQLFGSFDEDQSGFIERNEFAALAAQLNMDEMLAALDAKDAAAAAAAAAADVTAGADSGATNEAAAATQIQATWRGRAARQQLEEAKRRQTSRRSSSNPRSQAGAALLEKLVELELDEHYDQLRKIGVKRIPDLALLTDEELREIGMNKYDRAALLSARAEMQMQSGFVDASAISNSSSLHVSFAAADPARQRWTDEATRLFAQFSVEGEDGTPRLTKEAWAAMSRSAGPVPLGPSPSSWAPTPAGTPMQPHLQQRP